MVYRGACVKPNEPAARPSPAVYRNPFYDQLAGEQRMDPAHFALRYSPATRAALDAYLKARAAAESPATGNASPGNVPPDTTA
jgi:hypothetical protein